MCVGQGCLGCFRDKRMAGATIVFQGHSSTGQALAKTEGFKFGATR